jgi:hypothetical protein
LSTVTVTLPIARAFMPEAPSGITNPPSWKSTFTPLLSGPSASCIQHPITVHDRTTIPSMTTTCESGKLAGSARIASMVVVGAAGTVLPRLSTESASVDRTPSSRNTALSMLCPPLAVKKTAGRGNREVGGDMAKTGHWSHDLGL